MPATVPPCLADADGATRPPERRVPSPRGCGGPTSCPPCIFVHHNRSDVRGKKNWFWREIQAFNKAQGGELAGRSTRALFLKLLGNKMAPSVPHIKEAVGLVGGNWPLHDLLGLGGPPDHTRDDSGNGGPAVRRGFEPVHFGRTKERCFDFTCSGRSRTESCECVGLLLTNEASEQSMCFD